MKMKMNSTATLDSEVTRNRSDCPAREASRLRRLAFLLSIRLRASLMRLRYFTGTKPCSEMIFFPSSVLYRLTKSARGVPVAGSPFVYMYSAREIG